MKAEYRLQYRNVDEQGEPIPLHDRVPDYTETVEVSCPTELSNLAYAALKVSGADNVNFAFVQE